MQFNVLTSISGLPKTGKTHLGFTWPEPIKVFSFDLGAGVVRRKFPDKTIDIQEFILPEADTDDLNWALPVWEEFYAAYKETVAGEKYKTIVIDPATEIESVLRKAILEELRELKPAKQKLATNEYDTRNLRMKTIFDLAARGGVNLVVLQYLKPNWVKRPGAEKAEPTGELVLDGWHKTEGRADINLEMTTKMVAGKTIMVTTIKSNRFDRELNGKTFDDLVYDDLVALVFEED